MRGETGSSLEVHSGLLSPLSSSQERLAKEEDEGEFTCPSGTLVSIGVSLGGWGMGMGVVKD